MRHRYPVLDAARLAAHAYAPELAPNVRATIVDRLAGAARAYLLSNGVLLIPGSDEIADYFSFNLRILRLGETQYDLAIPGTAKGASGTVWHQGFLAHAKLIHDWMGDRRPKVIIGHSLGAAATQILSKSWAVTGIGFASPRTRATQSTVRNDKFCLNICRTDDPVCGLPGHFSHLGRVVYLDSRGKAGLFSHAMHHYVDILIRANGLAGLPAKWPV